MTTPTNLFRPRLDRRTAVAWRPTRFGDHHNAFGFLRLLLASLVIVSHTPELMDGDRHREILTRLFHSISFGELAVDGFFIISGFLITASYLNSRTPFSYLRKRVARIYPGFILASCICMALIGPWVGGRFAHGLLQGIAVTALRIGLLSGPILPGAFAGTHYADLDGAAWTIQYEFTCYLMVFCFGGLGLLRSSLLLAALSLAMLLLSGFVPASATASIDHSLLRLTGLFLAGSVFYLERKRIPLSKGLACVSLAGLCAALSFPPLAHLGMAICGGYLLLAASIWGAGTWIAAVNNENDISYGLYLYAWPIQKLLLWWGVSTNLGVIGLLDWSLALVAGAISWFALEKPVMRWARRRPASTPLQAH